MAIIYNKLVRDNIPAIISADGKQATTRVLSDEEYLLELLRKLDEESLELKNDTNIEELADLLEVIYAIASALSISREQLERVRAEKAKSRGAFNQKIFLQEVTDGR